MCNCIFRYQYSDGTKCTDESMEYSQYCKKHINKRNQIFEIMEQCLGNSTITSCADLFKLFVHIYDMPQPLEKMELFYTIVSYLLSRLTIIAVLSKLVLVDIRKYNKKFIITYHMYKLFKNTYQLSKDDNAIYNIIKIQRFLRQKLYEKITACNNLPAENTDDPFTYDSIDEIQPSHKFSYKDSNDHVYIFNAVEFEYFIRTNGKWNPYTKEEIPDYIINRLYILINYNRLQTKSDEEFKWQTPLQAYTEVSQIMEKAGFYTSVVWFDKIDYKTCKNIITVYRELCSGLVDGNMYFPIAFEMHKSTYVYDFAREIINLFKESDAHYLLCCNFIKALAVNIKDFYQNMPAWLVNLEQQQPALSAVTMFGRNRTNAVMFMYFQNMIDDAEENYEIDIDFDVVNRRYNSLTRGLYGMLYER